jgi:hypothetical protein
MAHSSIRAEYTVGSGHLISGAKTLLGRSPQVLFVDNQGIEGGPVDKQSKLERGRPLFDRTASNLGRTLIPGVFPFVPIVEYYISIKTIIRPVGYCSAHRPSHSHQPETAGEPGPGVFCQGSKYFIL